MPARYRIAVFGKTGCDKCRVLNGRIDRILASGRWPDFEKVYYDLTTEEGLIAFAQAECINPSRIPAVLVMRWNQETGDYEPIPRRRPPEPRAGLRSPLYPYLGLQTDYREEGGGTLSAPMVERLLQEVQS